MTMTDPIADMLTRIRNANTAMHDDVSMPSSNLKEAGLRVYTKAERIPRVLGGLGVAIVSTSRGLMTDREARKRRMGGEVLCYVW